MSDPIIDKMVSMPDASQAGGGQSASGDNQQAQDPVVTKILSGTASKAALSVGMSSEDDPQRAALYSQMAKQYHTTPEVVAQYPEEFKQRYATEIAHQHLSESPVLSSTIANNPSVAAIAHPDIPNLAQTESLLTRYFNLGQAPFKAAGDFIPAAIKGIGAAGNDVIELMDRAIGGGAVVGDKIYNAITGLHSTQAEDWAFRNFLDQAKAREPSYDIGQNTGIAAKSGFALGNIAGWLPYILGTGGEGIAANAPEAVPTMANYVRGVAEHGIKSMVAPAISGAEKTGQQVYDNTDNGKQALNAAITSYLTNSAMGTLPLSLQGGILKRMATGYVSMAALSEASRVAQNAAMPSDMQQPFSFEDTLVQGLQGAVLGAFGHPSELPVIHKAIDDAVNADVSAQHNQVIDKLTDLAANTKTRELEPQLYQKYISDLTDKSDLKNVYVPVKSFAQGMDEAKISLSDLQQTMPAIAEQINEAAHSDGYIAIPTADYLSKIAGTQLGDVIRPDVKADPAMLSNREIQQHYEDLTNKLKEVAKKVSGTKQERDTWNESEKNVRDQILGQLSDTGKFSDQVNNVYANYQSAMYSVLAKRLGVTPEEAYQQHGINITGEATNVNAFNQDSNQIASYIKNKYPNIKLNLIDKGNSVEVSRIEVPESDRGQGIGAKAMQDIIDWADSTGKRLTLTPSGDFGGNPERLKQFYNRFGFVENKGRNKDLEITDSMYRIPQLKPNDSGYFGQADRSSAGNGNPPPEELSSEAIGSTLGIDTKELSGDELEAARQIFADLVRSEGHSASLEHYGRTISGAAPESSWVSASVVREPDGSPAAVFRGATGRLEPSHFDRGALGKNTGYPTSGLGVFFSSSGIDASGYGSILQEFHLDIRNPAIFNFDNDLPKFDSTEQAYIFRESLRDKGHDGIIIDYSEIGGSKHLVAFEPEQVIYPKDAGQLFQKSSHVEQLKQGDNTPRGTYIPSTKTIGLLKNANLTTFFHETGHAFLDIYSRIASRQDAPADIKADVDGLMKWFGVDGDTAEDRLSNWHNMSLDEQRPMHEKFAEGFEKYLLEGRAPSIELQPLFSRVRAWMTRVYKSLKNIGIELTPEVRGVMDRMLASEDEIQRAEMARGYFDVPEKPEGVTNEEWSNYKSLGQLATEEAVSQMQSKSIQDMRWLSNAKSKAIRELQRKANSQRRSIKDQVSKDVAQMPVYRAQDFLLRGKLTDTPDLNRDQRRALEDTHITGTKLSEQDLIAMYGDAGNAIWRSLPRNMIAKDGGMHPDMVAEIMGDFNGSGDQMIREILASPPRKNMIEDLTDRRMLEEHGELSTPEGIEQAAEEAIHNKVRERQMATGLQILTKSKIPISLIRKGAKETAREIIASKPIMEIHPRQYAIQESRANQEMLKNAAKDPVKAAEAQRAALLNNQLFSEASKAKENVSKYLRYFSRFDKPKASMAKSIGADYMDRINEILSDYDLSNRDATNASVKQRQDLRDWLDSEYAKNGIMPAVSDMILERAGTIHWKEMTYEDMRGLYDSIKSLEHVGRKRTQVEVDGQQIALDQIVHEVRQTLSDVEHKEPVDFRPHVQHAKGLNKINAKFLQLKSWVRSADAALLKMEQMLQWLDTGARAGIDEPSINGPLQRAIVRRFVKAEGEEHQMRADSTKAMRELGQKLKDKKINMDDVLSVPELPRPDRGNSWYREELLSMALNMGNEGNKRSMLEGHGWTEGQAIAAINNHLSKTEMDFVQEIWNHLQTYGPKIVELQRRQTGMAPEMVIPAPLQTKFGSYDGGYYPLVYDTFKDSRIEENYERNADQLFENNYAKPSTNKGHTIERTGYTGPISLSLSVIPRHINQVAHDLAWREAIIDANKILSHPSIKEEIDQVMGKEYTKQLRPWLQAMANNHVYDNTGNSAWESFVRKARMNATMVGIGFRLSTMQIHGLSALSNSIAEVGPKWLAKGANQFLGHERFKETMKFVYDRSPEMAHRMSEYDRNIHEAIDEINKHTSSIAAQNSATKLLDGAKKFAFSGVATLDMASAMPVWMGAYIKGMSPKSKGGLDLPESDAIEYANRAVRNAHGAAGIKDLSAMQRDKGIMSLATMFYSYWNHVYNRERSIGKGFIKAGSDLRSAIRERDSVAAQQSTRDFAKLLSRSWYYLVIPQLIHAWLKPTKQDKSSEEHGLASFAAHVAEEVALGLSGGVPVLRDLMDASFGGYDYSITPLEQAGKTLVTTIRDTSKAAIGKETSKHPIANAAQAAGYIFGLPTGQASSTGKFLWDVYDGTVHPHTIRDWWVGLQTGHMPSN